MAVGLLGTIVPIVPGLSLIWAAGLLYGVIAGFGEVGTGAFLVMTVLAGLAIAAGVVLPSKRAAGAGASKGSIVLGGVGALVGLFVIPVVGFALIGIACLYGGERLRGQEHDRAVTATIETLKGMGWAFVAQFSAGLLMILCWLTWVILD